MHIFGEWGAGSIFSWRPADKKDWDEADWRAYRRYQKNLDNVFNESSLKHVAFDEEIHERLPDNKWRSIETGKIRDTNNCLEE